VIAAVALALPGAAGAQTFSVRVERGVRAAMRDGVKLAADIYRPDADARFPVLLQRTPYDRKGAAAQAHDLAAQGYLVVMQDVRGRFDSEGEFYPFVHEAEDGYDSVEWAAALPNSNGRVGMFGGSYVGATQMLAAMAKPPHLVAVFPYVTASEYYEGWTYQGGALMQWFASSWASGLAVDTVRRKASQRQRALDWVKAPIAAYPILDLPAPREVAPYFRDWVEHETDDEYWRKIKVSDHYAEMNVKGLHAGGWHDIFLKGSIGNYLGLRAKASTAAAREGQRLLVGPWAHAATSSEGKVGDVVFGKQAVLDMTRTIGEWSDYSLRGVANDYAARPKVRIFVLGENAWREEDDFPPKRARTTRYYLHASTASDGRMPRGGLSLKLPGRTAPSIYEYDPDDPVPTLGGRLCCGNALLPGPTDQRPIEARRDVLVFETPPLEAPLEVTGFISLELFAATSAVDTDFTAMLVDAAPDGYARYLSDGIVRGRYRRSTQKPEPIVAGAVEKYTIDLWATSNVFLPGHRLRLYVSSSNFPRFDRNRNTGEPAANATRSVRASQVVYHDNQYSSALLLPVVPREAPQAASRP
jgi:putative CocE/NonD family hydrolase